MKAGWTLQLDGGKGEFTSLSGRTSLFEVVSVGLGSRIPILIIL
jgi:hypothetical protein